MLGSISKFPDPFVFPQEFRVAPTKRVSDLDGVVFVGMGGSASAGDVLLDWLGEEMGAHVWVSRDSQLPRSVGKNTLVFCLSHSGETWETLRAFSQALRLGCQVAAVASGGRLGLACRRRGIPFLQIPSGGTPRAGLGKMVVAGAVALEGVGVVGPVRGRLRRAGEELVGLRAGLEPSVSTSGNRAKMLALSFRDHLPVIYAFSKMACVARRFKNQLAENSKVVAKYELLSEACHNEVEAVDSLSGRGAPLIIRDWEESVLEGRVVRAFKSTFRGLGKNRMLEVRVRAETRLGRLLGPILLLDYASAYLAILRGVDPSPTPRILEYKRSYALASKQSRVG
jgi:glucose/mannose-6-phosphate isomerase